MRLPDGPAGELFAAFSRVCAQAYGPEAGADTLTACPTLSKAPNYGDVLRRFKARTPHVPLSALARLRLACLYLLNNFGHLAFMLLGRLLIALLGWKTPKGLSDKNALVIDTFALLPRLAASGRYEEMYLPGLEAQARAAGREPVLLFRLYGSRNLKVLWKALRVLAGTGNACTEMHLLRFSDWFALLGHIFVYPPALRRLIRDLTAAPELSAEYQIRSALIRTSGQCVVFGAARRTAGFRLGLALRRAQEPAVFSWHENQTINKCFVRGLRRAEAQTGVRTRVVGAQLFIWPAELLNNHPDPHETDLAPDLTLVNGSALLPEAPPTPYAVGPSLRYGRIFEPLPAAASVSPAREGTPADGKPLLVLLSYHPDETRRILELVLPYAQSGNLIAYKFHPADNPANFSQLLPPAPRIVVGDLFTALAGASAVIGSGSGSLAEACALGVPVLYPLQPADSPEPDLNYLPSEGPDCGLGTLWASVASSDDIQTACALLAARAQEPEHPERVRRFRDLLFTKPIPELIRESFGL
jgi:hypothetical protein